MTDEPDDQPADQDALTWDSADTSDAPPAESVGGADVREGNDRLCGYRGCRAPLPRGQGRGNRPKYCQDNKTWGPKQLSCKQAEAALDNAASLGAESALDDASISAVGAHVDRALTPVEQLAASLTDLRGQLDDAVTAAHRERTDAQTRAIEAEGRADAARAEAAAAESRAEEADKAAEAAARRRAEAETARDQALTAQRKAERGESVAEARLADAQDTAARAQQRADEASARAEQAEHDLAGVRAELAATQQSLEEERQRLRAETDRAERALADAAAEATRLRTEHQQALDAARTEAEQRLQQAESQHRHELDAVREQAEQARRAEVSELHTRIGELTAELRAWPRTLKQALQETSQASESQLRNRVQSLLPEPDTTD